MQRIGSFKTFFGLKGLLLLLLSSAFLCIFLPQNGAAAPPANDMFANATVISGPSGSTTGTNVDATAEAGEPSHGGGHPPVHSVWFKWTATSNNSVIFDTNGSSFDTVLAAHQGTAVNAITWSIKDDDSGIGHHSQILFNPTIGQVYYIAVDSTHIAVQGQIKLNWGPANYISGTVSLPGGMVAPSAIPLSVVLTSQYRELVNIQAVNIPAGSSSAAYSLSGVLDPQQSLTVYYIYGGSDYLSTGYYNASGTQWSAEKAGYFAGGTSRSGINLTLLSGNTVSGSLILPGSLVAPPGGTLCNVYVLDEEFYPQQTGTATIASGESSVTYTVLIPNSSGARRALMGNCTHSGIYSNVYYNSSGSMWDESGAEFLSGGNNYASRNMIFFPAATISGTLSLPSGDVAPVNFQTSIFAYSGRATWPIQQLGSITSGNSTWTYSMTVPSDPTANWRVSYWGASPKHLNYLWQGFYTGSDTHWNPANAQLLSGGVDHANIDLTVIAHASIDTITISGKLNISERQTAPFLVSAVIQTVNSEYWDNRFETITGIDQDEYSGDYTITLPRSSTTNWIARYLGGNNIYEFKGYYRGSRTVCSTNNAFRFSGSTDHSGINLYFLHQCPRFSCFPANAQGNGKSMICF